MSATAAVVMLALVGLFSACSSVPARDDPQHRVTGGADTGVIRHGTVTAIDVIPMAARYQGAGASLCTVIRAPAISQAGNGIGRSAAPGLGALGGTEIGSAIEPHGKGDGEVYRISVRLDDGRIGKFDCLRIDDLQAGHRVRIEGRQLHRL